MINDSKLASPYHNYVTQHWRGHKLIMAGETGRTLQGKCQEIEAKEDDDGRQSAALMMLNIAVSTNNLYYAIYY